MKSFKAKIEISEIIKKLMNPTIEIKDGCFYAVFEIEEDDSISDTELKINPNDFKGEWINFRPASKRGQEMQDIYWDARTKGRLHPFTCMVMAPSVIGNQLIYRSGLPIKTDFSILEWKILLKNYNPERQSRMLTRTEKICKNLYIVWKLSELYGIEQAWEMVFNDSEDVGNYYDLPTRSYQLTGSKKTCGFCDLGSVQKLVDRDPWDEEEGYWITEGNSDTPSYKTPIGYMERYEVSEEQRPNAVGEIGLD